MARLSRAPLVALAVAQAAYGRSERSPRATRGIVALVLATSLADAIGAGGRRGALAPAAAGAIGFGAELTGVATGRPFGHYAYSDRLGPRVRGVPLLAAAAWAMMARPAWAVAGRLSRRRAARIPLAAAALTAWDVYLDPRMVAEGYWHWPGGGRYEGVPLTNFAGWFATGLVVFAAFAALDRERSARPADAAAGGNGTRPYAAGAATRDGGAVALYVWTWLGEGFANAALWERPRVALAGGAAMGAFAIPALWRR
jgi:putative membrane protein